MGKEGAVLLELLKQGITMRYVDPLVAGWHDVQEVAKTYWHVALALTRVQHSLLTRFLPLYRPDFARFWRTSLTCPRRLVRVRLPYRCHIRRGPV